MLNISLVLVAVVALSVVRGQTTPNPCPIEINVDYLYNDITKEFVPTANACQDLCSAYPTCAAWTYVVQTTACWLKSAGQFNRIDSPGRISGTKCLTAGTSTVTAVTATTTVTVTPPSTTPAPETTTTASTSTTTNAGSTTTTTAATTTVTSKKCFIEFGVEYKVANLGSSPATNKEDCCTKCSNIAGCKSWTFYTDSLLCIFMDFEATAANQRAKSSFAISGVVTSL